MSHASGRSGWIMAAALLVLAACGGGDPAAPDVAPTVAVFSAAGTTVAAGATAQLTARVTDKRAQPVAAPAVVWTSSAPAVATVSADGLVTAATVGSTTVTAASLGVVGSLTIAVTAGPPAKLIMRTQPTDVPSGQTFAAAPVVEVRDARDNLVTESGVPVSVAFASGAGTLGGTTTVTSSQGVAAFSQLVVSGLIGPRSLIFSVAGVTPVSTASFNVTAGAASRLAVRVAPSGGGLNTPFSTQPILDVFDNAGNLASTAALTVTAAVTAGGGALTGATAPAAGGVVTFAGFGVTGSAGVRTLSFTAPGLAPVPIALTPCDPARLPVLALSATVRTIAGQALRSAVSDTLTITDSNGSCTAPAALNAGVTYTTASGWLTASLLTAPARLVLRADPSALNAGTYFANVALRAANAATLTLPVTFSVAPSISVRYGLPAEKVHDLDVNGTLRITPVVLSSEGGEIASPITFTSRSPSIATVAADGRITARLGGQAWIVAQTAVNGGAQDSIFVNVARTTGPLLRADITRFEYARNASFSITLSLDTRGATVGAAQLVFTWPTELATPAMLRLMATVPGTIGSPVIVNDNGSGTTRVSIAAAGGMTGVITLGRFDFIAMQPGTSQFVLRAVDLLDLTQQSLLPNSSAFQYPVVIK